MQVLAAHMQICLSQILLLHSRQWWCRSNYISY